MVVDCAALVDLPMSMGMSMLGGKATRQVSQTQKVGRAEKACLWVTGFRA